MVEVLVSCALIATGLALVRIVTGPTHADRIVALDILLAAGIGLCVAAALAARSSAFLDVAIGLALVGFVATVSWARVLQRPRSPAGAPGREEQP